MSNYPTSLDTDTQLYLVHDSLRVKLAADYNPGDTSITIDDATTLAEFPPTGVITLTEQCNFDPYLRAISFSYTGYDVTIPAFTGLTLLPGFTDVAKPKGFTNVTMNVFSYHHNALKDALINVERFAGKRGEISTVPGQGTMEQRINYLRKIVLRPKAWFTITNRVGVVPFTVNITDLSLRAPTQYSWDFGDGSTQVINFPFIHGQAEGTSDTPPTPGNTSHTYTEPGSYDVTLTVTSPYGTDTVVLPGYISARTGAPDEATILFDADPTQQLMDGVLRTKTNTPVSIAVNTSGEQALDPVTSYSWSLGDDIPHPDSTHAEGLWSLGGVYDVTLRANTSLGAFRITNFPGAVDVVEPSNVWLGVFDPTGSGVTQDLSIYEFGLLSETFKVRTQNTLAVNRDSSFLTGQPNQTQQQSEFLRNNGMTPRSLIGSGDQGTAMLYWASGSSDFSTSQTINFAEYCGFTDIFSTPTIGGGANYIPRNWNWAAIASPSNVYFMFGTNPGSPQDMTDTSLQVLNLGTLTVGGLTLKSESLLNGANELLTNVGDGTDGEFSVYRTCWRNSTGFLARNDGAGEYFRIKSFYRTEGLLGDPVRTIRKLPDIPGSTKTEGQLVSLANGVYFFNNTGEVALYNQTTNVWSTGGPGIGSPAFSSVQDVTATDFDDPSNPLVAAGDGSHNAYLSFNYSPSSFIRFSELDLTFSKLPDRPSGEQFNMTVF